MPDNLFRLLQLSDPTLPVGGYAHSSGLETYVQKGVVKDKASARAFAVQMLSQNIRYTDAAFVSLAYDAAKENNWEMLLALDAECTAVKLPKEMRQASQKLGMRLLKIFQPLCVHVFTDKYKQTIEKGAVVGHYCIAFGIAAYTLGIAKEDALHGFYYNAAVGMITNCVKLVPLGQQDGQELLFSLHPLITDLVHHSITPDKEWIGLCCTGFDIRCMQHEFLYSRLYMS
ncbi:MAG: urease accessory protein UreF [Flavisolibacter sp.]|nr:urease accessory protein UreF [Flavisolibacter sp.]